MSNIVISSIVEGDEDECVVHWDLYNIQRALHNSLFSSFYTLALTNFKANNYWHFSIVAICEHIFTIL